MNAKKPNTELMDKSASLAHQLLHYWQAQQSAKLDQSLGVELIETHISWVILAGDRAYKMKKPVDFGFVNFTTLERRRFFCEEELRLNKRTAAHIYLSVMPVSGTHQSPLPNDDSAAIEYLLVMKRFPDNALMLDMVKNDTGEKDLTSTLTRSLALSIADFHNSIALPISSIEGSSTEDGHHSYGSAEQTLQFVSDNFRDLRPILDEPAVLDQLKTIESWSIQEFNRLKPLIIERKAKAYVRECHGDLHLGNIFIENEKAVLFDCIEFDQELRWIDTICDLAFTLMDLDYYDAKPFSFQLLNEYLENTGDYGALPLVVFYKTYRAMVRAKVSALRSTQSLDNKASSLQSCKDHLLQAEDYQRPSTCSLILFCGLSGTGKSTLARQLVSSSGAIQIRSDVERKRLYQLAPLESSENINLDLYSNEASEKTFNRLEKLADDILSAGYSVIVDATFVQLALRERFEKLAQRKDARLIIIHPTAADASIRARLEARKGDASEAGFSQYLAQKEAFEGFTTKEQPSVISIDTEIPEAIRSGLNRAARLMTQ